MKRTMVWLAAVGAWMGMVPAGAQVMPVPADDGARAASADKPAPRLPQRSPLWMAVESEYRQRGAERAMDDRRLTAAQRQELREQIRRGSSLEQNTPAGSDTNARLAR